jgi:hypothetical protein
MERMARCVCKNGGRRGENLRMWGCEMWNVRCGDVEDVG